MHLCECLMLGTSSSASPGCTAMGRTVAVLICRWFDNTLFTIFRGKRCYDGGLTNFIPLPPTQHGVRVCCFPSKQITTIYDIGISPDNYEDWPHTLQEMLSWAFEPAEDKLLLEFIGELPSLDLQHSPAESPKQRSTNKSNFTPVQHTIWPTMIYSALPLAPCQSTQPRVALSGVG